MVFYTSLWFFNSVKSIDIRKKKDGTFPRKKFKQ